jgi:hypothetical protein
MSHFLISLSFQIISMMYKITSTAKIQNKGIGIPPNYCITLKISLMTYLRAPQKLVKALS